MLPGGGAATTWSRLESKGVAGRDTRKHLGALSTWSAIASFEGQYPHAAVGRNEAGWDLPRAVATRTPIRGADDG